MTLPRLANSLRPPFDAVTLLLLLAAWLTTAGNLPLWLAVSRLPEMHNAAAGWTLVRLGLLLFSVTVVFVGLLLWPWWRRVGGLALLVMAGMGSHFMLAYGVVLDAGMLANALHTDAREVRDLLTWSLLPTLLFGVLLPVLVWWWLPARTHGARRTVARQLTLVVLGLCATVGVGWSSFQDLATLMRNHPAMRYTINPFNTLYASARLAQAQALPTGPLVAVGTDAVVSGAVQIGERPLLVLVVGETARSANFGVAGYTRDTTPRMGALLASDEAAVFRSVSSCGTSTQVSVPCMFSPLGRQAFGATRAAHENLLDVLQRAGYGVFWLDNQSGCKGVCDRVPHAQVQARPDVTDCPQGECLDEALLRELPQHLQSMESGRSTVGTVLVLHQMGSHGPAYHARSTSAFKVFGPECTQAALRSCDTASIVNAYDHSIRYTDHVLGELVDWLRTQRRPAALLYVSDHGESLGESGLYLHGMPYALAPAAQTQVPMFLWFSEAWVHNRGWVPGCWNSAAERPASHDNFFHSVLALARVQTRWRDDMLNLLERCDNATRVSLPASATAR